MLRFVIYFICAVIFLLSCNVYCDNAVPSKIQLNDNYDFVDNYGRVRMFHGINSVLKEFPWYRASLLNETQIKLYKEWGFNIVRLGTMWSGFVPQKNTFNETYISIQKRIVSILEKYGLYSILDMHQDVISSRYGSYDGVPRWLIDSFPQQTGRLKFPWPRSVAPTNDTWFLGYTTYAVCDAFQHLYANTSGSFDHWAMFWKRVAKDFGGFKSVIGYELINEPWAGNIYLNPLRVLPGYTGRHNLVPVYDFLTREIRTVDQTTLLFYEPVTWGVYSASDGDAGTGFHQVPGGPQERKRSVLSYHYYCALLQMPNPANPFPYWEQLICDDVLMKRIFTATAGSIKRTGGARFFTEFGLCAPDNSSISINTVECHRLLTQSDEHLQSWVYWDSQFFDDGGNVIWERVPSFARAYPRATVGLPQHLSFNITTAHFNYTFILNTTMATAMPLIATEIFVPTTVHYRNGFQVNIQPTNLMQWTFDKVEQILSVTLRKGSGQPKNPLVTISINKK